VWPQDRVPERARVGHRDLADDDLAHKFERSHPNRGNTGRTRMKWPTSILLPALLALLAPAVAHAGALDSFSGAKLQAASGTLTIKEMRCPPGSNVCGVAQLDETFEAKAAPKTRSARGRSGFAQGLRVRGKGSGKCYAESPATVVTGPDGSEQFVGSAARVDPGNFAATRIAVAASKRGLRVAWLEPISPSISCDYFDERGTEVAVPSAQKLQSGLVSRTIAPRVLKRSRFSITVAGSQGWTETAGDGTRVTGRATWKLRLDYAR
jgi:hypothetical protein